MWGPGNLALNEPAAPEQDTKGSHLQLESQTGIGGRVRVAVSHRSSGPLLRSGAPQDRSTDVGVSE